MIVSRLDRPPQGCSPLQGQDNFFFLKIENQEVRDYGSQETYLLQGKKWKLFYVPWSTYPHFPGLNSTAG